MNAQPIRTASSLLVLGLITFSPAPVAAQSQQTLNGYLFSKLEAIGSKNEGPSYFLQKFDDTEIKIKKHALMFEDDAKLKVHRGEKVTITGALEGDGLSYKTIEKCPATVKGCERQWVK